MAEPELPPRVERVGYAIGYHGCRAAMAIWAALAVLLVPVATLALLKYLGGW